MTSCARGLITAVLIAAATLLLVAPSLRAQEPAEPAAPTAYSIELPGAIDPSTEQWIGSALADADEQGAELIIIRLDTPGGLIDSMRSIVQEIIAAPQPVVVYVSPDGARAASAGLFITQAADVAAMAPQTNIGSATPVSIGPGGAGEIDDTLGRKIENDAAAYVRALATEHGRNGDLAEEMVREATNVTATEALDAELIDLIAGDQQELLAALDGFEVQGPKEGTLDTEGLEIVEKDLPLQYELLGLIVNPNIAFLLILIGLAGIGLELFNPGTLVPGAIGATSMLLGLYGSAQLPVTIAGVLLLVVGVALIIAETQIPSGVLGVVGVVALAAGGLLLYDTDSDVVEVSPPLVIALALVIGGALVLVGRKVAQSRGQPVRAGQEELIGAEGEVRGELDPRGQVFIVGALWTARAVAEGERIPRGVRVRVESIDGLTLRVSRLADQDASEGDASGVNLTDLEEG